MEFRDLLVENGVPFHEGDRHTRHGWLNMKCPRCQKDPYLGYNLAGRYTTCWSCGYVPLWEVVQSITGLSGRECFAIIEGLPQNFLPEVRHTGKLVEPRGLEDLGFFHTRYLESRGFDPVTIHKLWGVRGLGVLAGKLKWRLYIPVHLNGEVVSWTTRAVGNREPRYWSAKDSESAVPIENLLYGVDHARNSCVVVEGPADVWAVGPGAVATLGLRTSPAQLERLSRFAARYVCFDREPEAQRRARQLCGLLSVHDGKTANVELFSGKDPASASKMERAELRKLLD